MYGTEVEVEPLSNDKYKSNQDYIFAIDLFNYGFFWESHVYWEALWHKAGRKGEVADFLKALIKLAAAGVKYKMDQRELSISHLERAMELLGPLKKEAPYFGVQLNELMSNIRTSLKEIKNYDQLKIELKDFT